MKLNARNIADGATCKARWGCGEPGVRFKCYLCGHKFVVGDGYVMHVTPKHNDTYLPNFLSCDKCRVDAVFYDGIEAVWAKQVEESKTRFWWVRD